MRKFKENLKIQNSRSWNPFNIVPAALKQETVANLLESFNLDINLLEPAELPAV